MKNQDLEKLVKEAFDRHPANKTNNDLCYVSVVEAIYRKKGLQPPREFLDKLLKKEIPSSHSLAAAISNVRAAHPEYELTDMDKVMKLSYRNEWIERRNNYISNKRK